MTRQDAPSAAAVVSRSLILWVVSLSIIFVLILSTLFVWFQLNSSRNEHSSFTASLSKYVQSYIIEAQEVLTVLSRLQALMPQEEIPLAMQALLEGMPRLERLVLLDGYGNVQATVPGRLRGLDLPVRHDRQGTEKYITSRPNLSTATGNLTIYLEIPASLGGSVGGELRLNELQNFLMEFFPPGDEKTLALCDPYGNLVAHSDQKLVLQQANIGALPILEMTRRGLYGTSHFMVRGTPYIGTTARVPDTDWTVLVYQPALNVYMPILQALGLMLLTGLIFVPLVVAILRSIIHKTLSVPLAGLVESIRSIASNKKSSRPEVIDAIAEFSHIGDEVESMGEVIRSRERELRSAEKKYRGIFESIPDGFYRADLSGNVLLANPEGAHMLGYDDPEQLVGMNIQDDIYHIPADREKFKHLIAEHGTVRGFQTTIKRRDGTLFEAESNSHLVYDDATGEPIAVEGIFRDVTERKRMQQVLVQTEKMMSVGGLAAGMAHEINNPLSAILQGVQNLSRRLSSDLPANAKAAERVGLELTTLGEYVEERGIQKTLNGVQSNAIRAAEIVKNMLNFSRTSNDDKEQVDLNEVIDSALKLASSDYDLHKGYDFRSIEIIRSFSDALPRVLCKRTEIEQVALNILRNAAHAMDPAKENHRITVETAREGGFAVMRFSDNGKGIDQEHQSRIFEPFFTTKPPGIGTGLGLSVSYFIITQNHSGQIEVTSEPGKGTTFTIRLPLVVVEG